MLQKFTMGLNIAKRKSEGKGTSASNNAKRVEDQGKLQNNYFQNAA